VLGAVLVFFVLAGLYEGWSLPLAVILVVPMCVLCAITGVAARGMDNNIFTEEVASMVAYECSPLVSGTNGAALRVDGGVVQACF
jgi:AcrB/AcrD/AcrF family